MVRKSFAVLLLLSVFWQSALMGGAGVLGEASGASGHTVLHWQNADHHHHDDGSLHADDSAGALQHLHAESVANSTGLVTAGWNDIALACALAPMVEATLPHPSPFILGLLRPPATLS